MDSRLIQLLIHDLASGTDNDNDSRLQALDCLAYLLKGHSANRELHDYLGSTYSTLCALVDQDGKSKVLNNSRQLLLHACDTLPPEYTDFLIRDQRNILVGFLRNLLNISTANEAGFYNDEVKLVLERNSRLKNLLQISNLEDQTIRCDSLAFHLKLTLDLLKRQTHKVLQHGQDIYVDLCICAIFLQCSRDLVVSGAASILFSFLVSLRDHINHLPPQDIWDIFLTLSKCNEPPLQTVGFRLAVLYIRGQQDHLRNDSYFQDELIKQPSLWKILHGALLSESATLQKYALYILSQSVKAVDRPVDVTVDGLPLFCFRPESRNTKIRDFQLFITIYEIVIVDSSIHQSEAALADLTSLLRAPLSSAHLEPAWSCLIISRGLNTSMDSIRKLMIDYVTSLPFDAMPVLGFDGNTIPNYFLPIASQAHYFSIVQQHQLSYCPYGNLLSEFLSRLVTGVGNASSFNYKLIKNRIPILLNRILSFLCCRWNAYDTSRIFILSGLADGCCQLDSSDLVMIGVDEINLLARLLASPSDSPLGSKVRSIACLRLLAAGVDLRNQQVLHVFIDAVASIGFDEPLLNKCFTEFNHGSIMSQICNDLNTHLDGQLQKYLDLVSNSNSDLSKIKLTAAMCKWANTDSFRTGLPFSIMLISDSNNSRRGCVERAILEVYDYLGIHINGKASSPPFSLNGLDNPIQDRIIYLYAKVSGQLDHTSKDIWASILRKTDGNLLVLDEATVERARLSTLAFIQTSGDESSIHNIYELISMIDYSPKADVFTIKESDRLNDQLLSFAFDEINRNYCGSEDILLKLVQTVNSRFPFCHSSQPRLSMCQFLYNALDRYFALHSETKQLIELLTETVSNSIAALVEDGFSISDRKMHQEYIRFLLCRPIVRMTASFGGYGTKLEAALVQSIDRLIKEGFSRKAILPHISEQLYNGLTGPGYDYHRPWVGKLLIRLHTFLQTTEPLFKSDGVLAQLYSTWWIANGYENSIQLSIECFGPYTESFTRGFVLSALSSLSVQDEIHRLFANEIIIWLLESPQSKVFQPIQGKDENERIRVFSFQMLALLIVEFNYQPDKLRHVFLKCLKKEPSPWVRCYMEWIISRTLLLVDASDSTILDKEFFYLMDDSETVARYLVSLHVIGSLVAKRIEPPQVFVKRLFDIMIPFATSNRALIRHSAISQLVSLISTAASRNREENTYILSPDYNGLLQVLKNHIEAAPQYSKFKSGDAIIWDVKDDFTLSGIAGGVLCRISEKRSFQDIIPRQVFSKIIVEEKSTRIPIGRDYIAEEEESPEHALPAPPFMKLSGAGVNGGRGELIAQVSPGKEIFSMSSEEEDDHQVHIPLQTKSGLWTDIIEAAGGTTRNVDSRRGDLIIVASLVDKAPNLGGICRLSDVLGAKLLCIDNLSVTKTREFQNVAVTADRWMPMQQVPVDEIEEYLKWAKIELGYTLIGLEQTDESIVLDNSFKFPEKSIVLLGKEREGIPANLLAILDCCLEIRQLGVIRSMNIQTATAVLVYAYSIQHCT